MVDNVNPTSQFHPYRPETSTPATDSTNSMMNTGLGGLLGKLGLDTSKIGGAIKNTDVRGGLNNGLTKARTAANANPGMVLGGLAALVIGAGLMRKRSMGTR